MSDDESLTQSRKEVKTNFAYSRLGAATSGVEYIPFHNLF
jgi:hypothetical protein